MAKTSTVSLELQGLDGFQALLKELPAAVQGKVLGDAVSIASRPVNRRAKQLAAVRTGALKRSITTVVRKYPSGTVVALTGPDRGYYRGTKKLSRRADRRGADKPANYAHLVEFGHRIAKGGKLRAVHHLELRQVALKQGPNKGKMVKRWVRSDRIKEAATGRVVTEVPARPFIRPALEGQRALVENSLADSVEKSLDREIKRIKRKTDRRIKRG